MTKKVKLFDLKKKDYPHQRGDVFRSRQVAECWVCQALTNRVVMGGHPGYGVRLVCPNSSECWHHELENKLKLLHPPHPKSYKDELQKEIDEMKKLHKKDIKNDLEGNYDKTQKRPVTNVRSFKNGSTCSHFLE